MNSLLDLARTAKEVHHLTEDIEKIPREDFNVLKRIIDNLRMVIKEGFEPLDHAYLTCFMHGLYMKWVTWEDVMAYLKEGYLPEGEDGQNYLIQIPALAHTAFSIHEKVRDEVPRNCWFLPLPTWTNRQADLEEAFKARALKEGWITEEQARK